MTRPVGSAIHHHAGTAAPDKQGTVALMKAGARVDFAAGSEERQGQLIGAFALAPGHGGAYGRLSGRLKG